MFDLTSLTFDDMSRDIYPEVVTDDEAKQYSNDTVYRILANAVRIGFIIDLSFIDGTGLRRSVTKADLTYWHIDEVQLVEAIRGNGHSIPIRDWAVVGRCGKCYQYPVFTRDWTSYLLNIRELNKSDLNGLPLVMIPIPENIVITGDRDPWGIRSMFKTSRDLAEKPITAHPLQLINGNWVSWNERSNSVARTLNR